MTDPFVVPGCIVCVLASTDPPDPPELLASLPRAKREKALVQTGIHTGVSVATKFLFVYGVKAVRAKLCPEHRAELDRPVHGGGLG